MASMRSPGRPRSVETHRRVLLAALAQVRDVGYDAATIEGIAARAGVGKATVYRWWPSRELLIVEAIGDVVAAIPSPDTGTLTGDVLVLMRATMRMYQDPATGPLLSGLVAAMTRHEAVGLAVRSGFVRRWRHAMRAVLRRGISRGELHPECEMNLVLDMLSGPLFYRYLMLGRKIDEAFVVNVVERVLRAFAHAPTRVTSHSKRSASRMA